MKHDEPMRDAGDETFDTMLRAGLIDRPEPYPASNLAARVMDQARVAAKINRVPARRSASWVERVATFLAAAALAVIVFVGVQRFDALQSSATTEDSTTSTSSTSTQELEAVLLIGGAALAATLVYLAVQGSTTLDEGRLELTAELPA